MFLIMEIMPLVLLYVQQSYWLNRLCLPRFNTSQRFFHEGHVPLLCNFQKKTRCLISWAFWTALLHLSESTCLCKALRKGLDLRQRLSSQLTRHLTMTCNVLCASRLLSSELFVFVCVADLPDTFPESSGHHQLAQSHPAHLGKFINTNIPARVSFSIYQIFKEKESFSVQEHLVNADEHPLRQVDPRRTSRTFHWDQQGRMRKWTGKPGSLAGWNARSTNPVD